MLPVIVVPAVVATVAAAPITVGTAVVVATAYLAAKPVSKFCLFIGNKIAQKLTIRSRGGMFIN